MMKMTIWCRDVLTLHVAEREVEELVTDEAKFVQSLLLDWGEFAEIEHFVDNSSAITLGQRSGFGGMHHMETRHLWV